MACLPFPRHPRNPIAKLGIGGRVVRDVRSGFREQAYFAVIEADRVRGHDVRAQQPGLVVHVSRPHSKASREPSTSDIDSLRWM